MRIVAPLAALHGLFGVAFAAIGAHVVHDPATAARVATAATIELVHAPAALLALAMITGLRGRVIGAVFVLGAALFASAVYVHALGGPSLGPVAPIGGTLLMLAWAALAAAFAMRAQQG